MRLIFMAAACTVLGAAIATAVLRYSGERIPEFELADIGPWRTKYTCAKEAAAAQTSTAFKVWFGFCAQRRVYEIEPADGEHLSRFRVATTRDLSGEEVDAMVEAVKAAGDPRAIDAAAIDRAATAARLRTHK